MDVKVVRSLKRLRTVSARMSGDTLVVHAPAALSDDRLERIIVDFKLKFEKKKLKKELDKEQDLFKIASAINEKYFNNSLKINSIEYVTSQNTKFGCCDYRAANIRISHRVGLMPHWVRDYVIIHEMVHLLEPNHSKPFWDIVSRYKLAERARGFLLAAGFVEE